MTPELRPQRDLADRAPETDAVEVDEARHSARGGALVAFMPLVVDRAARPD